MNRKNRDGRIGHTPWSGAGQWPDSVTYVDLRPRTDQLTMAAERDPAGTRQKSANDLITWPAV
ncbi:hypothetical protein E0H75_35885 [Kribbella capetownensis]|uniref:Uncharacterized protein n=1 Tax=Kribbella capetownensis TaxID=1572659 RepID=A0A4R0JDV3_9ACTN|nr:hypothetical protein [Kribbella capetownensis]TCC44237.1 hypothetical protein E0H75_35885 [Kribbella capetownensis]